MRKNLILCILAIVLIMTACVAAPLNDQQQVLTNSSSLNEVSASLISTIKDIVNICFFIITAVIGILTYSKARKTLLQPIKTEVFKLQLTIFTEIMELFNGKGEMDLRKYFALEKVLTVNAVSLLDTYSNNFFGTEIKQEDRPYSRKDCPFTIVKAEFLEKYSELVSTPIQEQDAYEESIFPSSNLTKAELSALWDSYTTPLLQIPRETSEAQERLTRLLSSPVLPSKCVTLIKEILDASSRNISLIFNVLDEIVKDIPEKYPTFDDLTRSNLAWIYNKYNQMLIPLEPLSSQLTDYLRDYLKTDSIMN